MLLGVVSLTFRELSKIISRKYTTPEMTFTVRISSWNFVRVPKALLRAHVQSFSLKFSSQVLFLQYTNFERIFWRARETLVKQPPGSQLLFPAIFLTRINSLFPEICLLFEVKFSTINDLFVFHSEWAFCFYLCILYIDIYIFVMSIFYLPNGVLVEPLL